MKVTIRLNNTRSTVSDGRALGGFKNSESKSFKSLEFRVHPTFDLPSSHSSIY